MLVMTNQNVVAFVEVLNNLNVEQVMRFKSLSQGFDLLLLVSAIIFGGGKMCVRRRMRDVGKCRIRVLRWQTVLMTVCMVVGGCPDCLAVVDGVVEDG